MDEDDFIMFDDPDIELIEEYGVDIEEVIDDLEIRLNEMQFNVSNDEASDSDSDGFPVHDRIFRDGPRLDSIRAVWQYNHASEPPRSNVDIFRGIENQVIKESPTMRLFIAAENGQLAYLEQALSENALPEHNSSARFQHNILKARMKKIGLNKHQYQNVNDKAQESDPDSVDPICKLLIEKHPTLLDQEFLSEIFQKELVGMLKFTLNHVDSDNAWQSIFQNDKQFVLTQLFKEHFIDKAVDESSLLFLPILNQYGFSVSTKCRLVFNIGDDLYETKWINLFDKFVQSMIYKMERFFRSGWEDINTFNRSRLMDKSMVVNYQYSMIFSNLCDLGVDIYQEISCFDEHASWGIEKTFPNYLLCHLLHLAEMDVKYQTRESRYFRKSNLPMLVICDLIGVCVNKRIGAFLKLNNTLLSKFVSFFSSKPICLIPAIKQKSKNAIILELVQRWKRQKTQDEEDWIFQKTLLDSKGRKAFSSRGRGGRTRTRSRLSSSSSQFSVLSTTLHE